MKKVIIISGPTAVGKSQLGIDLALRFMGLNYRAAVINFDSLLFYSELNIGTCKPSLEERQGVPHHLIDVASIRQSLNAAQFILMARTVLDNVQRAEEIPILVGGSGFYLQALMEGMYESNDLQLELKQKSDHLYKEQGILPFLAILEAEDPETAQRLHKNDHYRVRRAVEHFWSTGKKFSAAKADLSQRRTQGPLLEADHHYLDIPKDTHQHFIRERTVRMFNQGFEQEVQGILNLEGITGDERPLNSIGYKEMVAYLRGKVASREDCLERTVISTRQLAKAQRTWFNKVEHKTCHNPLLEREGIIRDIIKRYLT